MKNRQKENDAQMSQHDRSDAVFGRGITTVSKSRAIRAASRLVPMTFRVSPPTLLRQTMLYNVTLLATMNSEWVRFPAITCVPKCRNQAMIVSFAIKVTLAGIICAGTRHLVGHARTAHK